MNDPAASTRQRLLDAGAALFLQQGFDATSLDQVRQQAGVSNGSLYHHFPSKAHLARALYLDALARYHAHVGQALQQSPAAAAGVRALVARHIGWVQRHVQAARVLSELRPATRIDGQSPDWAAANAQAFERLRSWIADETAAARMRPMSFDLWLALVLAPAMARTDAWLRAPRVAIAAAERELLEAAAVHAVVLDAAPAAPPMAARGPRTRQEIRR